MPPKIASRTGRSSSVSRLPARSSALGQNGQIAETQPSASIRSSSVGRDRSGKSLDSAMARSRAAMRAKREPASLTGDLVQLQVQHKEEPKKERRASIFAPSLERIVSENVPQGLSSDHIQSMRMRRRRSSMNEIIECFRTFDTSGDGFLSRDELRNVLQSVATTSGGEVPESDVDILLAAMDTSCDGLVDYIELLAWLLGENPSEGPELQFRQASDAHVSSERKLELAKRGLLKAEQDAMPPVPLTIWLTDKEIQLQESMDMFIGPEEAQLKFKGAEINCVIRNNPMCKLYKAGVRPGWYCVEVGGSHAVHGKSTIPELMVQHVGGGGGAARGCALKFVSAEDFQRQKNALDKLSSLREAVRAAERAIDEQVPFELPAFVVLRYYGYSVSAPTTRARITLEEIDELLCLSSAFQDGKIFLADRYNGDCHLYRPGEAEKAGLSLVRQTYEVNMLPGALDFQVDGTSGRVVEVTDACRGSYGIETGYILKTVIGKDFSEDLLAEAAASGSEYTLGFLDESGFSSLVGGRTYAVIVEQELSQAEITWLTAQRTAQEEDRLAALPEHDCAKEQIPLGLRISTRIEENHIFLDNHGGMSLGLISEADPGGTGLNVLEVLFYGLFNFWNVTHPKNAVRYGDRIVEVNGIREDPLAMQQALHADSILNIKLCTYDYVTGNKVKALYFGRNWHDAVIERANPDGTFAIRWSVGRTEEDLEKTPFDLQKIQLEDKDMTQPVGDFRFAGNAHNRPEYVNSMGSKLFLASHWMMTQSEDSIRPSFISDNGFPLLPPRGDWANPVNCGKLANITYTHGKGCRICGPRFNFID